MRKKLYTISRKRQEFFYLKGERGIDTIFLHYTGHTPSVDGVGVSGEVGTCILQVTFNNVWTAYTTRTAVLVSSFGVFVETLDANDSITVPATVVPRGDEAVRVSVFGTAQTQSGRILRYNGEPIRIRFYAGGETAKILTEPEMTNYERLLARLEDVEADLSETITQAETAATGATSAARTAQTAATNANTKANAANTATTNANTATANAITATQNAISAAAEARSVASGKTDKVSGAVNGNLAGLDSTGNLTDSGVSSAGELWTFTLTDGTTVTKAVLTGAD